ncbi:hypothetical protein OSB94_12985 [Proteus vulgaris]|uniref:hypothetical protein n=1 Tax=Proteus vulgaris TaxID=585 RepID=UPI00287525EF|nr:hypothetical protein [Proteus vulgaris]MDS0789010.1 hypothetical protein [Proteus vulgaris]
MRLALIEASKTGEDKEKIYAKYREISERRRQEAIADGKEGKIPETIASWEELKTGIDQVDTLKWIAWFDSLSTEDRRQLVNFVKNENEQSAQGIFNSATFGARVALGSKEGFDSIGMSGPSKDSGITVRTTAIRSNKDDNNQRVNEVRSNYRVHDLKQISDPALNVSKIREELGIYVKKGDTKAISVATASVTIKENTEYFLSVSGKSWKGNGPQEIVINKISYKVIVTDTGSIPSKQVSSTQTNYNHAEQKIFSYIQDNYKDKEAIINLSVENTSISNPGMCNGCSKTAPNFAENNPKFTINIYQGTTGQRP